jgi:hypothetical protein
MAELRYHRTGQLVELKVKGMSNHEIRTVLLGLWKRLDEDDQVDFIKELQHYRLPESELPALAQALTEAEG